MSADLRVLLVEDEAVNAMLIVRILGHLGYEVALRSSTGEGAIQLARKERPDLVIMDIGLPGAIDGIEAAKTIRAETGAMILFVTGYEDRATRDRAQALEPIGYLTKPLPLDRFRAIINGFNPPEG